MGDAGEDQRQHHRAERGAQLGDEQDDGSRRVAGGSPAEEVAAAEARGRAQPDDDPHGSATDRDAGMVRRRWRGSGHRRSLGGSRHPGPASRRGRPPTLRAQV